MATKNRWCFIDGSPRLSTVNTRDSLLAALVATIWGFNFIVIDWGMADVPPLLFVAIRFTAVVLPAIFFIPRPSAPWRSILAVGVFMSLGQFGFLYVAMSAGMPPGLAALVLQAQVVFTVVIAAGVLREVPTAAQSTGVALGVVGLVIVAMGRGGHVPMVALVLCLLGALSWGIGNVVSRAARVPGGLSLTVWSALVVPLPLLALSLAIDGPAEVSTALAVQCGRAVGAARSRGRHGVRVGDPRSAPQHGRGRRGRAPARRCPRGAASAALSRASNGRPPAGRLALGTASTRRSRARPR